MAILLPLVSCVVLGVLYRRHIMRMRIGSSTSFQASSSPRKYTSVNPHWIPSSNSSMGNEEYHLQDDVQQLQENPIYGNIHKARRESHLNYASLDLNVSKHGQKKPRVKPERRTPDHRLDLQACLSRPPVADFQPLEAEGESGGGGSRSSIPAAFNSGIYLNSQQIALETEEWGRDERRHRTSQPPAWRAEGAWQVESGGRGPAGEKDRGEGSEEESGEGGLMATVETWRCNMVGSLEEDLLLM
ncbi:hypothetical protein N1851_019609 [Merluccius polli]|uniref:Uncharacterized protein n=1 Tax=Merluccius polli TaxID=89951 RepID=A0AA47MLB1_MERPO|nr:hypothetical protein N1851_019609 [Merluccius polli]